MNIYLQMLFGVVGGVGIFMLGMKHISDSVQGLAGEGLRRLVRKATGNRVFACLIGAFVTSVIQASSVTTIIAVGFVNGGIMTLRQAMGVIMGANIGTTMTAWILTIKVGVYGLPLLGVAALVYIFCKKETVRYAASAFMGLGMIFFGLDLITRGLEPIRSMPRFLQLFQLFTADSYWGVLKCAFLGCGLTIMVQSSSAMIGITMGLASAGIIEFPTAAGLVLGENIGTTVTAMLASIGQATNARRAAYFHCVFNVTGVLYITALFPFYIAALQRFAGVDFGLVTEVAGKQVFPHVRQGIAAVHTCFNLLNTLVFLPLVPFVERLLNRMIRAKRSEEGWAKLKYLFEQAVVDPGTAAELADREQTRLLDGLVHYIGQARCALSKIPGSPLFTAPAAGASGKLPMGGDELHAGFIRLAGEIRSVLKTLLHKHVPYALSERILNLQEQNDILMDMEKYFSDLAARLEAAGRVPALNNLSHSVMETLDAMVLAAREAKATKTAEDIEVLLAISSDRGEMMAKIRRQHLDAADPLGAEYRIHLLALTTTLARLTGMFHRFAALLAAAAPGP